MSTELLTPDPTPMPPICLAVLMLAGAEKAAVSAAAPGAASAEGLACSSLNSGLALGRVRRRTREASIWSSVLLSRNSTGLLREAAKACNQGSRLTSAMTPGIGLPSTSTAVLRWNSRARKFRPAASRASSGLALLNSGLS